MTTADIKSLARDALDLWASDTTTDPAEILTEGYRNHQNPDAEGGVSVKSREEYLVLLRGYHAAFSDSTVRVLMQIAERDLVASRWEFTAVHSGAYLGHPATHRRATWTGVQIDRIEGRRVAESWVDWDKYRLLETLGLLE